MEVCLSTGSGEGWLRDNMTDRSCHETVKRLWYAEVHRFRSRTRVTQRGCASRSVQLLVAAQIAAAKCMASSPNPAVLAPRKDDSFWHAEH